MIIQNFNSASLTPGLGTPSPVAPLGGGQAGPSLVSPGVTNFAQSMGQTGSAIMNMGSGPMGSLFGPDLQAAMLAPGGGTLAQSGFDIDRAVALTREKIAAGKTTGSDLFAQAIASSGGE